MRPLPYSLRQLQYAVAVAEERSFRRAAERCHVAQPSLSAQIAELEDALGVSLFERGARQVTTTAAGEVLVARARGVLREADDLVAEARGLADPLAATLRIGVIPTVSPYLLPGAVPPLREHAPRLTVLWSEGQTSALLEQLRASRLDAVVLADLPGLDDLVRVEILRDPFVLATAPGDPLDRAAPAVVDELDDAPLLLLEDGHCLRAQALEVCARIHPQESSFRATSLSTLARMVAAGVGVTLMPELALPVENRRGDLVVRRFAEPAPSRRIVLAWRRSAPLGEAMQVVANALRAGAS